MRKPLGFYSYELLSGIDTQLLYNLDDDKAILRKDTAAFNVSFPFDWAADPFGDENWCFQLHCWRMGDKWLHKYFETGSLDALKKTFPIIEDWHRFHFEKNLRSDYSWYDMSAGIRAARISFYLSVIDEKGHHFDPDEIGRLTSCLDDLRKEHINFLTKDKNLHNGNHGIFQLHGLMLLASCAQDNHAIAYASDRFNRIMGSQYTTNGLHTENSPEYHIFVLNLIKRLKLDELFSETLPSEVLEKANDIKKWLAMPDGRLATFGDTSSRSSWPKTVNSQVSIKNGSDEHLVKDISDDGLLVVRNNKKKPDYFAATFGGHSYVHKHADIGQIILWHKGALFLADPGKYIYGKSEERDRVVSAVSHGVIDAYPETLHPTDIKLSQKGSYKTGITILRDRVAFSTTFFDKSGGVYMRHIDYSPENYLSIRDIAYREQGKFISRLKFNGSLSVESSGDSYILNDPISGASISLSVPSEVEFSQDHFGLSKQYNEIDPAWIFEAVSESGKFIKWNLILN